MNTNVATFVTAAWLAGAMPLAAAIAAEATPSPAAPVTIAVAEFDYVDTSGEPTDQVAAHRARVADFGTQLRQRLAAQGYAVRGLDCADACTPASAAPADLAAAAAKSGARLLVAGGIHKMSTLIQWGEVRLVDLDRNAVLLQRTFSFRGDTDTAYRRAAEFVSETIKDAMPRS
jgi:hypothetical protein